MLVGRGPYIFENSLKVVMLVYLKLLRLVYNELVSVTFKCLQ